MRHPIEFAFRPLFSGQVFQQLGNFLLQTNPTPCRRDSCGSVLYILDHHPAVSMIRFLRLWRNYRRYEDSWRCSLFSTGSKFFLFPLFIHHPLHCAAVVADDMWVVVLRFNSVAGIAAAEEFLITPSVLLLWYRAFQKYILQAIPSNLRPQECASYVVYRRQCTMVCCGRDNIQDPPPEL